MKKTWNNLEIGDILINKEDNTDIEILGIAGRAVFVSSYYNHDVTSNRFYTIEELMQYFRIKQIDESNELSIQEIADKFGIDVEDLKIKKD